MAAGQCSPIRGVFAGAGARWGCCPPPRGCSQEDKLRIRAQLRLGSGNRRTADCWNRTSVEKGTHRRKAPVPVRGCFAGAGARGKCVPPGSLLSSEDSIRIRVQLRLGSGNRRRTNTEGPNSVERGAHRRKAPVPVRGCFAGAGASAKRCLPTRVFFVGERGTHGPSSSLCKIFLTSLSHFPLQIIPTGVLLSAYNRNLKTL